MKNKGKKILIFTQFSNADEAYSLNRVVQDQIQMFVTNGYKVVVTVAEGFTPVGWYAHSGVELRGMTTVPCHNEVKKDPTFDDDVDALTEDIKAIVSDVDFVISHDLIYQPSALKHNVACRKVAKDRPELKWAHWIHSATSPYTLGRLRGVFTDEYARIISEPFPNSYYVFFNHYSIPRIAENFKVDPEVVKIVHHPSDVYKLLRIKDKLVIKLAEKKKLLEADAVAIYPVRLDRGKQVQMVIKTLAMLKDRGFNVRVIVVDFHSTGGDKVTYRDELKQLGIDWGLNAQELTFTSEFDPEWTVQIPHESTAELFALSNVFIQPSVSESYSLTTQEFIIISRGVLVLNQDFPPFRDIFGPDAIYRKFSSNIDVMSGLDGNTTTQYGPNDASPEERVSYEKDYHRETAGMIANQLRHTQAYARWIKIKRERNLQYIFTHELEPLIYG
jgi:glycosyltransferase involved in cell wall biosynthesis